MTHWTQQLDAAVDTFLERAVQVRRHLHAFPEPSGHESQTTRYLRERLREAGLATRFGPQQRGVIADLTPDGSSDTPVIALRADIDALRIQDAKTVEYRSRVKNVMHACGHDAHVATVLAAVWALAEMARNPRFPFRLRCRAIFQPAEETNRGALEMIQAGALANVEALLSLHLDPSRPAGHVSTRSGTITADCDELHIEVHGRGGHASRPHEALDPIAVAAQLISSIYQFVPRSVGSHDPVVVTIGSIRGGENYNVIPDKVELGGTLRSLGPATRQRTIDRIRQLARGLSEATGARIEVMLQPGPPSVYNDPQLTELLRDAAVEVVGEDCVHLIGPPSMGGEDFANYLVHVPGSMFRLGSARPDGDPVGLHSPLFDIDEKCIAIGARMLTRAVINWHHWRQGRAAV